MTWSKGKCDECGKTVATANVCPHCNHRHSKKWKQSNENAEGWAWIFAIGFFVWAYYQYQPLSSEVDIYCDGPVTWHYPGGEHPYEPHVAWDSDTEKVIIKICGMGLPCTDWRPYGDHGDHRISGSTVYWTSKDSRYRIVAENCN